MSTFACLPESKSPSADGRLRPSFEEISFLDREALRELLFNEGRYRPDREKGRVYCNKLTHRSRRSGRRFNLSFRTRGEEKQLEKLLTARRGPEREIKGFVVADWEPTERTMKVAEEEDGVFFVSDPDRWW